MLRDTLYKKVFNGELAEGVHEATLILHTSKVNGKPFTEPWQYMAHKDDPAQDMVVLTFKVGETLYKRNMFNNDMNIMIPHLRRQLGRAQETMNALQFLMELGENKTPFKIWISYPTVLTQKGPKRVQNINFLEPLATPAEDNAAPDMEVPPFTP